MRPRALAALVAGGLLLTVAGGGVASASPERATPATTARGLCAAARALVTRSDQLAVRLADPAPDGVDRARLRSELVAALRRVSRASAAGGRFLADLPVPTDAGLARTQRAGARSLAASAREFERAADRAARFPTDDRDDWNAAVVRLRESSPIRSGDGALTAFRTAVRSTPRGPRVIAAARADATCVGSLVPAPTG